MAPGVLDTDWIQQQLTTARVGRRIVHLDATTSTNEEAWRRSESADSDGLVIFAEYQTAGRGRLGRSWLSPRGASVLASVILIDRANELTGGALAIISAVAARDAIRVSTDIDVGIKWPNDLIVNGRKTGGALLEGKAGDDGGWQFVLGFGINCLQHRGHFDGPLRQTATSLDIESDRPINRSLIAARLLQELDHWVSQPGRWSDADLRQAWLDRCQPLGRRIRIRHDGREFRGHVVDMDPAAGLIVELDGGGRRAFDGD